MFRGAFANKVVWLSGHTGFKGAWLAEWLLNLGATVHGFALTPPTSPALYDQLRLGERLHGELGDVRDAAAVERSIQAAQPDYVFHLAAQPLVRAAYASPVGTYAVNVLGTVHVLDALRRLNRPCAAVMVTTDKCYENREWFYGYREEDPLGGHDPYSSSKAAAEIAIQSFRRSFFKNSPVRIASARAGNVIGGGDWAEDRIVPDCVRHLKKQQAIHLRNPQSVRPWQHVLEPLSGYLWLATLLAGHANSRINGFPVDTAYNFGPGTESSRPVVNLVQEFLKHWPGEWTDARDPNAVHEAGLLQLSIEKARNELHWAPVWNFEETVARTATWYHETAATDCAGELTRAQITDYCQQATAKQLAWAMHI